MIYKLLFKLFPRRRWGNFWCDKHWSFLTANPQIDKDIAAWGIAIAMQEGGIPKGPHACCTIPDGLFQGITERSVGWK